MILMLVLVLLLGIIIGVVGATLWIKRHKVIPPNSVWVKDRWYTAEEIGALSMEQYAELRPYMLNLRPEGWEEVTLTPEEIQAESERVPIHIRTL